MLCRLSGVLLLLSVSVTLGSGEWTAVTVPSGDLLRDVHFADVDYGWIVGDGGTILRTTDGGATWQNQISPDNAVLMSVCFTDHQNGWIAGAVFAAGEG